MFMEEKSKEVKSFFEKPDIYLNYDYNLRIRTETLKGFLKGEKYRNVLDMPCGNGIISASLLRQFDHLTMVDFSEKMMVLAEKNVPPDKHSKVKFICNDIYRTGFEKESFDLVISLGILAHIDGVEKFITYIQQLTKPGGEVIIQNTDSGHFYSYLIRAYLGVRRLAGKDKYKMNKVKDREVVDIFTQNGFSLKETFRYNQSFLGFSRLFSNDSKYGFTRKIFGNEKEKKRQAWGSDVIYHFEKKV